MFESKLLSGAVLFMPLIFLFFVYLIFIKKDDVFIQTLNGLSSAEVYQAIKLDGKMNSRMRVKLGKFHDCLQAYKPLYKRRFPKGYPNNVYYLKVMISPSDLLFINVGNDKAYQVYLESIDAEGIYQVSSESHALNCDVRLIEILE